MCYNGLDSRMLFSVLSRSFMLRRPAVLPTSPRSFPNSSLFVALLHQSERHLVSFQSLPHSLRVYPGWHLEAFFNFSTSHYSLSSPVTLAESTLTADLRVLPCFYRNRPPATSVESTLTRCRAVSSLESALTKNRGGRALLTGSAQHSAIDQSSGRLRPFVPFVTRLGFAYWGCRLLTVHSPRLLPLARCFSAHFHLPPHLLYDIARLIAHPTARRFGGPHGH